MRISASTRNVFPNILQMLGNVHSKLAYQPTNTSFPTSFTKRYNVSTSIPIPKASWSPHPPSHPWPDIKGSRSLSFFPPWITQTNGLGKTVHGPLNPVQPTAGPLHTMLPLPKHPSQRELECPKSHPTVADYNVPYLQKIIQPVSTPSGLLVYIFEELEKTNFWSICTTNTDGLPNSTKVCTPSVATKGNKRVRVRVMIRVRVWVCKFIQIA